MLQAGRQAGRCAGRQVGRQAGRRTSRQVCRQAGEHSMKDFCCLYNLKNLVKNPTCFKNSDHPTCIDLILTNKSSSFQHTSIIETGLSDFHRLTVTVMKINFQKQAPKILYYRNYNHFNNELFRIDLIQELSTQGFHNVQCNDFEDIITVMHRLSARALTYFFVF